VEIMTDHRTLENFAYQKELSKRQAQWMEYLSQYEYTITYIPGEDNTVADALSRLPDENGIIDVEACAVFSIEGDTNWARRIKKGYRSDPWCMGIIDDLARGVLDKKLEISLKNGLLFIGTRLVIPKWKLLREDLFRLAHDNMGHFGGKKSYLSLRNEFYWPNMRRNLMNAYVPACVECQQNKSRTSLPLGPLHPLPVPDDRFESVAIDFIGLLPLDEGFDAIVTMTDRLGADIQIVPCKTDMTAEQFTHLFFDKWYCENGCPKEIISDRDKNFLSKFWKSMTRLMGIKHKLSTSYHPETDGSSEQSNKTVIQCLRFHVERNQKGWVRALPKVRFNIMNTVNESTGFSPFTLKMGRSPKLVPSMVTDGALDAETAVRRDAGEMIKEIEQQVLEARDCMLMAKIGQAHNANKKRGKEVVLKKGDRVLLSMSHRRREYMQKKDGRCTKFMPRFDGPYEVLEAYPDSSTYKLKLPLSSRSHPVFHASQLRLAFDNNDSLFPARELSPPTAIVTPEGDTEYFIERIIDERTRGRGKQYLVRWMGYGPEHDLWLPRSELIDAEALERWEVQER
jgi:hypothetical protein